MSNVMLDKNWARTKPVGIGANARPKVKALQLSALRPDGLALSNEVRKAAKTLRESYKLVYRCSKYIHFPRP